MRHSQARFVCTRNFCLVPACVRRKINLNSRGIYDATKAFAELSTESSFLLMFVVCIYVNNLRRPKKNSQPKSLALFISS